MISVPPSALSIVPGIGAGDLSKPNNLAAWIDRGLLPGHLYRKEYDPEGLLSTLPAIATTLIGVLTGTWLDLDPRGSARQRWLEAPLRLRQKRIDCAILFANTFRSALAARSHARCRSRRVVIVDSAKRQRDA